MAAMEQDDEAAPAAAEEKRELENAWKDLVKSVLSSTRIDPKYKGQQFEFCLPYEAEVTNEQVTALQLSNYGTSFKHFIQLWKALPPKGRPPLYEAAELFKLLSVVTQSPFKEVKYLEKDKASLSQLAILQKISFLTLYPWEKDLSQFNVDELAEQLNCYIRFGIEWQYIEEKLLRICINRAAWEQRTKLKWFSEVVGEEVGKKSIWAGAITTLTLYLTGFLLPILIWLAIDATVLIWSLHRLEGDRSSIWAIVGLVWIGITVPAAIIQYGTVELRHMVRKIIEPGWDRYKPLMHPDLEALNREVNSYRAVHINLRLVREQLVRLQNTNIKIPVQLLTLIDRSIAKGHHNW